jgi:hypothetical protein
MKKLVWILVAVAGVAGLIVVYRQSSQERQAEAQAEQPVAAQALLHRNAEGVLVLTLDAGAQQRLGLVIGHPVAASVPRRIKAYGRVLDPAPLAALWADLASAEATLEASSREFQRLKQLHAQGQNVALRAVETAEATLRRDQIAREALQTKLINGWGKALATRPDLSNLIRALVMREGALIRLDVPPGTRAEPPQAVQVFTLDRPQQPITASCLGPAPEVDPQAQSSGYLVLVQDNPSAGRLAPGQAVWGWLEQPGPARTGVLLPASAVVRAAGQAWVYVQTDSTNFVRRLVSLDQPSGDGWLVSDGLTAQDRLVVTGAQMLLSEEFKGGIRVGD